jgi:16S rRNA processing protein RimM
MQVNDCFYIGKIGKPKSFKGQVFVRFDADNTAYFSELNSFFLLVAGKKLVEYPIEAFEFKNESTGIVKFQGINNQEDADRIKNTEVYIPEAIVKANDDEGVYLHELIGFTVVDNDLGEIGKVESVNDNSVQTLLIVKHLYTEHIIPYVDAFVTEVDTENKTIHTNLPEGLLDMNE